MTWPIPEVPDRKNVSAPKYWFWIMILIIILILWAVFSMWLWKLESYTKFLFYGILPALLFWLCLFGVILNRYEQSVLAIQIWKLEKERTKAEWRRWSQRQLAVVGNVLFSPEEKGMEALLGDADTVPAYPKKYRPLFDSPYDFFEIMKDADLRLELQYPGYRHLLHSIYIFHSPDSFEQYRNESVYQQWNLLPTSIYSAAFLESLYDSDSSGGLILVVCFQGWSPKIIKQSSEFISAQLITSTTFARQHSLPVIAGITRLMPLEKGKLIKELDMLFEYIQPDKDSLEYIWLLGTAEKTPAEIQQYATLHQWLLPEKRPLYSIDFSFGPPGEMALPLSLVMLAEAANKTGKDHLLVNQTLQQTGYLCLITRNLYP